MPGRATRSRSICAIAREYSEGIAAAFKARLTHVNVNYRYVDLELIYLLDNADAAVVVYAAEFAPRVAAIRAQLPNVAQWIEVGGRRCRQQRHSCVRNARVRR